MIRLIALFLLFHAGSVFADNKNEVVLLVSPWTNAVVSLIKERSGDVTMMSQRTYTWMKGGVALRECPEERFGIGDPEGTYMRHVTNQLLGAGCDFLVYHKGQWALDPELNDGEFVFATRSTAPRVAAKSKQN